MWLSGSWKLTYDIWLQSFGHQTASHLQILWRTLSHLQATGHAHSLQNLDVIMDLKHAVKVEQILKPVDKRQKTGAVTGELGRFNQILSVTSKYKAIVR